MSLSKRRGQSLVEFAITVPVLMAFLIGIIDIGWLYNHQLILTNAAREGARTGTLGSTSAQVATAVKSYLSQSGYSPMPADSDIVVDLSGGMSHVTVNSTVPFLFAMSGPSINIKGETKMRTE